MAASDFKSWQTNHVHHRLTEVLDVGPIDLIHGISKPFVDILPDTLLSAEVKAQALDTEFHWVSEAGETRPSRLTSNMSLAATV